MKYILKGREEIKKLPIIIKACNHFAYLYCPHTFTFSLTIYSFFFYSIFFSENIFPTPSKFCTGLRFPWGNPSVRPDYQSEFQKKFLFGCSENICGLIHLITVECIQMEQREETAHSLTSRVFFPHSSSLPPKIRSPVTIATILAEVVHT